MTDYAPTTVRCQCGNTFQTRSTQHPDLPVDICSSCHPFYTGKQQSLTASSRVQAFRRRQTRQRVVR